MPLQAPSAMPSHMSEIIKMQSMNQTEGIGTVLSCKHIVLLKVYEVHLSEGLKSIPTCVQYSAGGHRSVHPELVAMWEGD